MKKEPVAFLSPDAEWKYTSPAAARTWSDFEAGIQAPIESTVKSCVATERLDSRRPS